MHVIIRFPNPEAEVIGLGKLAGRFSFKTWENGEIMVPEPALGFLASENVSFIVEEGRVMSALRRYEILLPRQFNDGRSVPDALIGQAVVELRSRFGAASCEIQIIQGFWHQGGGCIAIT